VRVGLCWERAIQINQLHAFRFAQPSSSMGHCERIGEFIPPQSRNLAHGLLTEVGQKSVRSLRCFVGKRPIIW
jgi:hypothetical protein